MAKAKDGEIATITIPNDQAGRERICAALDEMLISQTKIDRAKEEQKDIAENIKEEFGIPPSVFKKWAKMHQLSNADQVAQEADELVSTYQVITGN